MTSDELILQKIQKEITETNLHLIPKEKEWLQSHAIQPKKIILSTDPAKKSPKLLWLVTDHTGIDDSSYRIVLDPESFTFGLECTPDNGTEWYMGPYGSLIETVKSM